MIVTQKINTFRLISCIFLETPPQVADGQIEILDHSEIRSLQETLSVPLSQSPQRSLPP